MLEDYRIRIHQLTKTTDVSNFDCGIPELNEYLQHDAYRNQTEWLSVTKVMFLDGNLVGYFTITPDTLHKGRIDISDKLNDYPYQKYPAVKLARLAVDKSYQHRGFGKALMREFFYTAHQIAKIEGSRFIKSYFLFRLAFDFCNCNFIAILYKFFGSAVRTHQSI